MTPDYETNSCQMTFGLAPLPREEDPALKEGCLAECALGRKFATIHKGKECTVQPTNNRKVLKSVQQVAEVSSQK